MIRAGCAGFPVARGSYFRELTTVEIRSSQERLPRMATAESWKKDAPSDFVYSMLAWHPVTHPAAPGASPAELRRRPAGHFRDNEIVAQAWEATESVAGVLGARFIVFETPASFYPNADHLRDMYAFFKRARRAGRVFVWRPRGGWEAPLVRKVSRDLYLVLAVDPLGEGPVEGPLNYFRLAGAGPGRAPSRGHRYHEAELKQVVDRAGGVPTYAYLQTAESWPDAKKLRDLSTGLPRGGAHLRHSRLA